MMEVMEMTPEEMMVHDERSDAKECCIYPRCFQIKQKINAGKETSDKSNVRLLRNVTLERSGSVAAGNKNKEANKTHAPNGWKK